MKQESTMKSTRALFLVASLAALAASPAFAKPNFSGEWKIDAAKSDFGDMPSPSDLVLEIDHADPKLTVKQTQSGGPLGELTTSLTYATDGTETRNRVRDNEMTSTGKWSGDALTINTKMSWQGSSIAIVETWRVSGGGKTLQLVRAITSEEGASTLKLVFLKSEKKITKP
jgi:hypothetical protein